VETTQVLVKLPNKLLQKIDETVLEECYASRQEFIREAIREKIRTCARVELVEEEIHARRRKMRVEKIAVTPPPRSSLQRGVGREAMRS
jgi:metal-responsive CopG/Arc/MetJ family transcriptional regulator